MTRSFPMMPGLVPNTRPLAVDPISMMELSLVRHMLAWCTRSETTPREWLDWQVVARGHVTPEHLHACRTTMCAEITEDVLVLGHRGLAWP